MIVSQVRIDANRRNSLKSTGPKTPEGKDRSRANALKHGLCSAVLVPEDIKLINQRANEWYFALKPQNPHQMWLVEQVTISSIRIDRGERMERKLRDRHMLRAELAWDDDRAAEVEELAAKISRRPSEIARRLKKTPQGCDWLITRWAMLARMADQNTSWTTDQTQLAFNMLGTPVELREGHQPGDVVDIDGKILEASVGPQEVARREAALLAERREIVADLDECDRALAAADLFDDGNPELKRLRRYETTLHTRIRWAMKQIQYCSPHLKVNPDFKPKWVENDDEEAKAEVKADPPYVRKDVHPPFDLTPDEFPAPGEEADISKIIADRREKKARKADSRRDAKRRKVERLRT